MALKARADSVSVVSGHLAHVPRGTIEGVYVFIPRAGEVNRARSHVVPCPYCEGPMQTSDVQAARVVKMVDEDKGLAMVQLVPQGGLPLFCPSCEQMFTLPPMFTVGKEQSYGDR